MCIRDSNPAETDFSALLTKMNARMSEEAQYSAFVNPEIYAIPLETRQEIFADPLLEPFAYAMRRYLDPDHEPLSEEANSVLAILSPTLGLSLIHISLFSEPEYRTNCWKRHG